MAAESSSRTGLRFLLELTKARRRIRDLEAALRGEGIPDPIELLSQEVEEEPALLRSVTVLRDLLQRLMAASTKARSAKFSEWQNLRESIEQVLNGTEPTAKRFTKRAQYRALKELSAELTHLFIAPEITPQGILEDIQSLIDSRLNSLGQTKGLSRRLRKKLKKLRG